jgi:hypothetical protein
MNWLLSIVIAALSGALGLFSAGCIMSACVKWYRISGFEGGAGYAVAATALIGGIAGLIIGLLAARLVAAGASPGFLKGLGWSWGVILCISVIAVALCWVLADIPPKIKGQELRLEIELRLPAGQTNPPSSLAGESHLDLGSVIDHRQRNSLHGELKVREAKLVDNRWVVPGSVYLYTMRGLRSLAITLGGKSGEGFLVPLPARPGRQFEQWSEWLPRARSKDQPWPDTAASYRFRVQRIQPPSPEPDPAAVEAQEFAALKADAPLEEWLKFMKAFAPLERSRALMQQVAGHQAELARLIGSTNSAVRESALSAVMQLTNVAPEVSEAVLAEGCAVAEGIRQFNDMDAGAPDFYDVQIQLRSRFSYWHQAWWTVHRLTGVDGRPPVQTILDLALVRANATTMDEIVINARAHLGGLEPATNKVP